RIPHRAAHTAVTEPPRLHRPHALVVARPPSLPIALPSPHDIPPATTAGTDSRAVSIPPPSRSPRLPAPAVAAAAGTHGGFSLTLLFLVAASVVLTAPGLIRRVRRLV